MKDVLKSHPFPSGTLLGEIRPWLESCRSRGHQASSIRFLYISFRPFSRFAQGCGLKSYRDVKPSHLVSFGNSLLAKHLKESTQENYLQTAKSYFDWLEKSGSIFKSPARAMMVPRKPRILQRAPSESDLARVIDRITGNRPNDERDRAILELGYGAGLRLSELASLRIDSIDSDGCTVRVLGKGPKERIVPITRKAGLAVRTYVASGRKLLLGDRQGECALWIGRFGLPLGADGVRCRIESRAETVGVRLCPHDLRRAFATHLLYRGLSPAVLKELLGHATYSHLKEYLRYAPAELVAIHRKTHPRG